MERGRLAAGDRCTVEQLAPLSSDAPIRRATRFNCQCAHPLRSCSSRRSVFSANRGHPHATCEVPMKIPLFSRYRLNPKRRKQAAARRSCRPLVEQLERRELLAFNLTISLAATVGVTSTMDSVTHTTTFTAFAAGANL